MQKALSFIAVSLTAASFLLPAANAQSPQKPAALQQFLNDKFHCATMAAVVEFQEPTETARFETDIDKAADSIRNLTGLSYDSALFKIKADCDAQLMVDASTSSLAATANQ